MNVFYQIRVIDLANHCKQVKKDYRWFHNDEELESWAEGVVDGLHRLQSLGLKYGVVTTKCVGKRLELLDTATTRYWR